MAPPVAVAHAREPLDSQDPAAQQVDVLPVDPPVKGRDAEVLQRDAPDALGVLRQHLRSGLANQDTLLRHPSSRQGFRRRRAGLTGRNSSRHWCFRQDDLHHSSSRHWVLSSSRH